MSAKKPIFQAYTQNGEPRTLQEALIEDYLLKSVLWMLGFKDPAKTAEELKQGQVISFDSNVKSKPQSVGSHWEVAKLIEVCLASIEVFEKYDWRNRFVYEKNGEKKEVSLKKRDLSRLIYKHLTWEVEWLLEEANKQKKEKWDNRIYNNGIIGNALLKYLLFSSKNVNPKKQQGLEKEILCHWRWLNEKMNSNVKPKDWNGNDSLYQFVKFAISMLFFTKKNAFLYKKYPPYKVLENLIGLMEVRSKKLQTSFYEKNYHTDSITVKDSRYVVWTTAKVLQVNHPKKNINKDNLFEDLCKALNVLEERIPEFEKLQLSRCYNLHAYTYGWAVLNSFFQEKENRTGNLNHFLILSEIYAITNRSYYKNGSIYHSLNITLSYMSLLNTIVTDWSWAKKEIPIIQEELFAKASTDKKVLEERQKIYELKKTILDKEKITVQLNKTNKRLKKVRKWLTGIIGFFLIIVIVFLRIVLLDKNNEGNSMLEELIDFLIINPNPSWIIATSVLIITYLTFSYFAIYKEEAE